MASPHGIPHPCETDRPYTADEEEWLRAIEAWQRRTRRKFPTYTELLHLLKRLGYRKAAD